MTERIEDITCDEEYVLMTREELVNFAAASGSPRIFLENCFIGQVMYCQTNCVGGCRIEILGREGVSIVRDEYKTGVIAAQAGFIGQLLADQEHST